MAFKKGASGNPKGRKAGTPNKLTTAAKSAIEAAADGLGGAKRLQAWAQSDPLNERVFWSQIYTKLLPLQVTDGEGQSLIPQVVQFLISKVPGADCKP
jgi:hypothetical protein